MRHEKSAEEGLRQLCDVLALQYERQDWGIVNADGHRLDEFIRYYDANGDLSTTQKFEMGELILASANERLLAGEALPEALQPFILRNKSDFGAHLEYWRGLQDAREFPIGHWLRANSKESVR